MLTVHKITEYKNAKNETRLCVTFSKSVLAGLAAPSMLGSLTLLKDTTMEQALLALPIGSTRSDIKFGDIDANGFYSVVAS